MSIFKYCTSDTSELDKVKLIHCPPHKVMSLHKEAHFSGMWRSLFVQKCTFA